MKKVMVAMCVYKHDDPIQLIDSIESILNQDYPLCFYIYIDGPICSDLENVINNYDVKFKNLNIIISAVNHGLAYGLNKLVSIFLENDFDYFARMDADDISLPNRISLQVKFLESNPLVSVVGSSCYEFGSIYSKHIYSPPCCASFLKEYAAYRNPLIHPSVVIRDTVFRKGFRYPTAYPLLEDLSFWYSLLNNGLTIANIDKPLIKFRMSDDAILRRSGFGKAYLEFRLRFSYASKMEILNFNVFLRIFLKFLFQISPVFLLKFAYRYLR